MAELEYTVQVTGLETIDQDWQKIYAEIKDQLETSSYFLMDSMTDVLKKHINEDVYEAYPNPKRYERRSDDPSLGTPLNSQKNMTGIPPETTSSFAGIWVKTGLEYHPTGEHDVVEWHTADDDELIGRIENSYPPYDFPKGVPKRRLFWQNFVDELITDGVLESSFMSAMAAQGVTDLTSSAHTVERDANDGHY